MMNEMKDIFLIVRNIFKSKFFVLIFHWMETHAKKKKKKKKIPNK